jgi:hypothetical protein
MTEPIGGVAVAKRTEPYAIASIVCAVANFVGPVFIGAILAIVFGKMAEKRLAADPSLDGAGFARAGIILGWVGLAIPFVMLVVAFGLLALTAVA